MWNTPSLLLLQGQLWPDSVPSMGQIELFDDLTVCKQRNNIQIELLVLHGNIWNHSTVRKHMFNDK